MSPRAVRFIFQAGAVMSALAGAGLTSPRLAATAAPSPRTEAAFWYDEGHRLVARLAAVRLTPRTAAAVRELLGGQSLADAALWADRIRTARPDTKPLHYVNIPLGASGYEPARDCPDGRCIIAAIERERQTLADANAPAASRAEALRFLAHFIADLHQPLHVADNGDRGGNDRPVTFLGATKNLHEVWDGELIEASGLAEEAYYVHLRRLMDSVDPGATERGSVVDWAMEGHRVAALHAYRLPHGARIDRRYVQASLPTVDRALVAAGIRLARVLNDALTAYPSTAAAPPAVPRSLAGQSSQTSSAAELTYADLEASAHIGETATVVGTVATVRVSRSGNIYLNFGADYPHQTFSGAILRPRGTWTQGLDSLAGRRVGLRGRISAYKGQVQIVIERPDQIVAPAAAGE
jgi:hypothetical protein